MVLRGTRTCHGELAVVVELSGGEELAIGPGRRVGGTVAALPEAVERLPLVLVVADDVAFARSLEILLEEEGGCDVRSVRSADAALVCLGEAPPPSLLIGDLDIGRDEAERLVDAVRQSHPGVAVLLLTAHDPALMAMGSWPARGWNLVGKPVDPAQLLDLVALHLVGR